MQSPSSPSLLLKPVPEADKRLGVAWSWASPIGTSRALAVGKASADIDLAVIDGIAGAIVEQGVLVNTKAQATAVAGLVADDCANEAVRGSSQQQGNQDPTVEGHVFLR